MKVNATVTTIAGNDAASINVIDTNISLTYAADGVVTLYDVSNSAIIASVSGDGAIAVVEALFRYMNETIGI